MGEAKRRNSGILADFNRLNKEIQSYGIRTEEFGFYDQPAFTAKERASPSFLNEYAKFVKIRPLTEEYQQHANSVVTKLADLLFKELAETKAEGICSIATMALTRMLDELGVWSFGLVGSTTFATAEPDMWRGFHTVDNPDFPNAMLGHSWVCAPPFHVIDLSATMQRWGSDPIRQFIPSVILDRSGKVVKPKAEDVIDAEIRTQYVAQTGYEDPALHFKLEPHLKEFGRFFPATECTLDNLTVRYVPTAVRQSDGPLSEIIIDHTSGRTALELWREVIEPAFQ